MKYKPYFNNKKNIIYLSSCWANYSKHERVYVYYQSGDTFSFYETSDWIINWSTISRI